MATKSIKSPAAKQPKTSAPKVSRARKTDTVKLEPTREMIAMRAYEMWCARGYPHGHDVDDWLEAERELSLT